VVVLVLRQAGHTPDGTLAQAGLYDPGQAGVLCWVRVREGNAAGNWHAFVSSLRTFQSASQVEHQATICASYTPDNAIDVLAYALGKVPLRAGPVCAVCLRVSLEG
jgi:hypothetical protein